MKHFLDIERLSRALGIAAPEQDEGAPSPADLATATRAAQDLAQLVAHPGWQRVLDMMEKRLDEAEHAMLSSTATDGMALLGLQRRARAYREMFDGLQADIQNAIEAGQRAGEEMKYAGRNSDN